MCLYIDLSDAILLISLDYLRIILTFALNKNKKTQNMEEGVITAIGDGLGTFAGELILSGSSYQACKAVPEALMWGGISGFSIGFADATITQLSLKSDDRGTRLEKRTVEISNNSFKSAYCLYYQSQYEHLRISLDYVIEMNYTPSFSTEYLDFFITPTPDPNNWLFFNREAPF